MSKIVNFLSLLLTIAITVCSTSLTVFAFESDESEALCSANNGGYCSEDSDNDNQTRGTKNVCSYSYTLIYTGKGADRWLHISPWTTPNVLTIKMVDYQGDVVWLETFTATYTTHWFIGSNVKYVYLMGSPGGAIEVSDTEN